MKINEYVNICVVIACVLVIHCTARVGLLVAACENKSEDRVSREALGTTVDPSEQKVGEVVLQVDKLNSDLFCNFILEEEQANDVPEGTHEVIHEIIICRNSPLCITRSDSGIACVKLPIALGDEREELWQCEGRDIAILEGGKYAAIISDRRKITIRQIDTGDIQKEYESPFFRDEFDGQFRFHQVAVEQLASSREGKIIAASSQYGEIVVWEWDHPEEVLYSSANEKLLPVLRMDMIQEGGIPRLFVILSSIGGDPSFGMSQCMNVDGVWEMQEPIRIFSHEACFSPDYIFEKITSLKDGYQLCQWYQRDLPGDSELEEGSSQDWNWRLSFKDFGEWDYDVPLQFPCFAADGKLIVHASLNSICVLDGSSGNLLDAYKIYNDVITAYDYSPVEKILVVGTAKGNILFHCAGENASDQVFHQHGLD